jgi:hypothetical protein
MATERGARRDGRAISLRKLNHGPSRQALFGSLPDPTRRFAAGGRTKAEIAQPLGMSQQHLYDILRELKPASPATAVRLGKLFGDGAGVCRIARTPARYRTAATNL